MVVFWHGLGKNFIITTWLEHCYSGNGNMWHHSSHHSFTNQTCLFPDQDSQRLGFSYISCACTMYSLGTLTLLPWAFEDNSQLLHKQVSLLHFLSPTSDCAVLPFGNLQNSPDFCDCIPLGVSCMVWVKQQQLTWGFLGQPCSGGAKCHHCPMLPWPLVLVVWVCALLSNVIDFQFSVTVKGLQSVPISMSQFWPNQERMTGCICVRNSSPLAWQCKHSEPICHDQQYCDEWWCTSCLVGEHETWWHWCHCWWESLCWYSRMVNPQCLPG